MDDINSSLAIYYIQCLENRGVRFIKTSKENAQNFLSSRSHYYKVSTFLDSFEQWSSNNSDTSLYLNVDFFDLEKLAALDAAVRYIILEASLDLEHFIKVQICQEVSLLNLQDEGRNIVLEFLKFVADKKISEIAEAADSDELVDALSRIAALSSQPADLIQTLLSIKCLVDHSLAGMDPHHIENSFTFLDSSTYTRTLARAWQLYAPLPIGQFIEMLSFGDLIKFYKYFFLDYVMHKNCVAKEIKGLLFPTKTLRNAAAHNDSLLHCARKSLPKPKTEIWRILQNQYSMPAETFGHIKKIPFTHDLAALMICYDKIVLGNDTRARLAQKIELIFPDICFLASEVSKHDRLQHMLLGTYDLFNTFTLVLKEEK